MNRYLAINIEGKIGQPTVIRTSSFISQYDVKHIMKLQINIMTSVLKVLTSIITVILMVMSVSTFKTAVMLYIHVGQFLFTYINH